MKELEIKLEQVLQERFLKAEEVAAADRADARSMNAQIQEAENASWLAKNTGYILDLSMLLLVSAVLTGLFFVEIPEGNKEIVHLTVGTILGFLGASYLFHRGSSAGSKEKTKILFIAIILSLVSIPSLIHAKTYVHLLAIRLSTGLAGALFISSGTTLMANYVPRELRGRVMAAIGRGSVLVGAAGGGTGGPGMGYIFTLPVMVASILGGLLYSINPNYPWLCVLGTSSIQLIMTILFIRDPKKVER